MNLMFRKNFRAETKERSYGGGGKSSGGRLRTRGASRSDSATAGYTPMDDQPYRNLMLDKITGGHLMDTIRENGPSGSSPAKKNQGRSSTATTPTQSGPISLKTLDRDCFIIPITSLDRFLPAGVTLPTAEKRPSSLSVLEVDDPKLCVLLHLMTPMTSIEPELESPLARPLVQQKSVAAEILGEVGSAKSATEGMLLSNMEHNADIPFISYYVINTKKTDPDEFFRGLRVNSLRKFDPSTMRYTASHTMDLFNEVATIARPPLHEPGTKPDRPQSTGYIICIYKVFDGDDGEKFEKNWLYWTGARMLYRYLPRSAGLRRITLHKSVSRGDKMYLLLCECSQFLDDLSAAALLIPALRARLCGYTGLYRMAASF
ncbi:uncharacterized protein LOC132193783 [Neocloeon triangulifer]|uniref:uncharacterized protein LOC132193783 n=1 Tax=Neocloeon triangulifer TaxID=2078957 RepID=UPI00286F8C61|nr:uncharacterized protein LOC132193783 [Neocloeon triangulifer]